jgi:hypothetical protein
VVICVAIAALAFYGAFRATTPDSAAQLRTVGFLSIGIAAGVLIVKRLIARFLDS